MLSIFSQISYPVFIYCVFVFFIIASVFSFIVGIGLAIRNTTMLRYFDFMNRGFSTRKAIKPLTMPHFVEPMLRKRSGLLGTGIMLGAATSIFLLWGIDTSVFFPLFSGTFSYFTAVILAGYTKSFLLVGNGICVMVGLLALFFPQLLSSIEAYTDKWYTLRKQTRPLNVMHLEVDKWVLEHSTVAGLTLSILSLSLCTLMYARI